MKYVIASKEKAYNAHIPLVGHLSKDGDVILNEKEVTVCNVLNGTLEERAEQLDGQVYEYIEAMTIINEGGWKNE